MPLLKWIAVVLGAAAGQIVAACLHQPRLDSDALVWSMPMVLVGGLAGGWLYDRATGR